LPVPAARLALLLRNARGAASRLPRALEADRPRAGEGVPHPAPHSLWRRADPGGDRAGYDHRLLPPARGGRLPRRELLRQPLPAGGAPEVGDDGALAARGGPRPPPPDRARHGAGRAASVPPPRRLHRLPRRLGALRRVARSRDG